MGERRRAMVGGERVARDIGSYNVGLG